MTEASLLFPIVCILLSSTLTVYLYYASIVQAIQASHHLARRLIQYINNKVRHCLRARFHWFATAVGCRAGNFNSEAGEYELIESSSLHPSLIISPPDVEAQSSYEEESPRNSVLDSTGLQVNAMAGEDGDERDDTDDIPDNVLGTSWRLRQSRTPSSPAQTSNFDDCAAIDVEDLGIVPAAWEHERISHIEKGGPGSWLHWMVDRVAELLQTDFEADISHEIDDSMLPSHG